MTYTAPPDLPILYCEEADLQALLSVDGEVGRLDDDNSGAISGAESGYLTRAIVYASARVNFYCAGRYATADLARSWMVHEWCVVLAAQWLSSRRGNPPPGAIKDLHAKALEDLEGVRSGLYQLPEIGLRTNAWPVWSNITVDALQSLRKVKVQRPISERSPQEGPFRQTPDYGSEFIPFPF